MWSLVRCFKGYSHFFFFFFLFPFPGLGDVGSYIRMDQPGPSRGGSLWYVCTVRIHTCITTGMKKH